MTIYAVDQTGGSDANTGVVTVGGSDANAWKTRQKVKDFHTAAGFETGDLIIWKCAESWSAKSPDNDLEFLALDLPGTNGSHVTVRSYFLDGGNITLGVSGDKPIWEGSWDRGVELVGSQFTAQYGLDGSTFVDTLDIHMIDSKGAGIRVKGGAQIHDNCTYTDIDLDWVQYATIYLGNNASVNNTLTRVNAADCRKFGASSNYAWDGSGHVCTDCTVIRCKGEQYRFTGTVTATGNVTWGRLNSSPNVYYSDGGVGSSFSNGILIASSNGGGADQGHMCSRDDEVTPPANGGSHDWDFHDNLTAGGANAIQLIAARGDNLSGAQILHNIFIDPDRFLSLFDAGSIQADVEIKDNVFWSYTGDTIEGHAGQTPTGDWNFNVWPSDPGDGLRGDKDVYADPLTTRIMGWRDSVDENDFDKEDWRPDNEGSVKDAGLAIAGFNIDHEDVTREAPPNIGAFERLASVPVTPQDLLWVGM